MIGGGRGTVYSVKKQSKSCYDFPIRRKQCIIYVQDLRGLVPREFGKSAKIKANLNTYHSLLVCLLLCQCGDIVEIFA